MKRNNSTIRVLTTLTLLLLFFSAIPSTPASGDSAGPNNPATAINDPAIGTIPWTDPANIITPGEPYATAYFDNDKNLVSNYLVGSNYGFNIPLDVTILGITVSIDRKVNNLPALIEDDVISLVYGGSLIGQNKADPAATWTNVFTTAVYGGATDLWGAALTPAQVNDPSFGVALSANKYSNGNRNASINFLQVTVTYAYLSGTAVDCGSGVPEVSYGSSITCVATVTRLTGSATPSGTVTWSSDGSGSFSPNPCTLSGAGDSATCSASYTPMNVGSGAHLVTATYNGDANFSSSSASQAVSVTPLAITVTADAKSKAYGDPDPALTYQITSGSLVFGDAFTGSLTRAPGEDIGDYAILQGSLELSNNYVLSYVGADFTITPRPVTVTADAKSKAYGDPDPALTYQVTSGSLLAGDAFSGALSREPGEDVGVYAILQGSLALPANYTLSFGGADFTITPRPITVTADAKSKTYGEPDPALTYRVTSGSLLAGDDFSGNLSRESGENVGVYAILQGTLALPANYTLSFVGADFIIVKATPTLSITNSPVPYDGLPHAADVVGSVPGTVSNVTYDGIYTLPINVGSYAVTADFTPADSLNYHSLSAAPAGDFVIMPVTLELSLTITPTPSTYNSLGDVINYRYMVTNNGNVSLGGPFVVIDEVLAVSCPVVNSLAPGETLTCSATYTTTAANVLEGSFTNTATASASYGGEQVLSAEAHATITYSTTYRDLYLPLMFQ